MSKFKCSVIVEVVYSTEIEAFDHKAAEIKMRDDENLKLAVESMGEPPLGYTRTIQVRGDVAKQAPKKSSIIRVH